MSAGHGGVRGAEGVEGADPVVGVRLGLPLLQGCNPSGPRIPFDIGRSRIGEGLELPEDVAPFDGRSAVLPFHLGDVAPDRGLLAAEAERSAGHGQDVDAVDLLGVGGPPRGVGARCPTPCRPCRARTRTRPARRIRTGVLGDRLPTRWSAGRCRGHQQRCRLVAEPHGIRPRRGWWTRRRTPGCCRRRSPGGRRPSCGPRRRRSRAGREGGVGAAGAGRVPHEGLDHAAPRGSAAHAWSYWATIAAA